MPISSTIKINTDDDISIVNLNLSDDTDIMINTATITAMVCNGTTLTIAAGAAVNKGNGKVGIPCTGHSLVTGQHVRITRTGIYDGEFAVDASSSTNEIVITATYTAMTFLGTELIYVALENGYGISLSQVSGSDGEYKGLLPHTLKLIEGSTYYIWILIVVDTVQKLVKNQVTAQYATE
jgi:hypothetical protein